MPSSSTRWSIETLAFSSPLGKAGEVFGASVLEPFPYPLKRFMKDKGMYDGGVKHMLHISLEHNCRSVTCTVKASSVFTPNNYDLVNPLLGHMVKHKQRSGGRNLLWNLLGVAGRAHLGWVNLCQVGLWVTWVDTCTRRADTNNKVQWVQQAVSLRFVVLFFSVFSFAIIGLSTM